MSNAKTETRSIKDCQMRKDIVNCGDDIFEGWLFRGSEGKLLHVGTQKACNEICSLQMFRLRDGKISWEDVEDISASHSREDLHAM